MIQSIHFNFFKTIALVLSLVCCGFGSSAEDLRKDDLSLALLRLKNYPDISNWDIQTENYEITLISKFEVAVSGNQAILVEENTMNREAISSFFIKIRFEPMVPYSSYQQTRAIRIKFADMINEDYQNFEGEPLSDEAFDHAWSQLDANRLPSHIAGNSNIYIETSLDDPNLSFSPDDSLQTCIWMLYRINFLFSEIVK